MVLLFLGASGSGKDTQADILEDELGFKVVSSGEALRAEVDSGSVAGRQIEEVMAEGEWVDDKVVFEILENYLRERVASNDLIFTGAVRTIEQIEMFDEMLAHLGLRLDHVIYFELDDETATERLLSRGREDDTREAIIQRLAEFHEDNRQIISAYENRGILLRIDASRTITEIAEAVKKNLRFPVDNGIELQLKKLISQAFKSKLELEVASSEVQMEHPADPAFGDWSTNAALKFSKDAGMPPRELAELLVAEILANQPEDVAIEKLEVAGPGFINFTLSLDHYLDDLTEVLTNPDFGKGSDLAGRRVVVEYTDPNPFKEFHIGHLYSNAVGEALSRILEAQGAELKRACYQGDVGLHVAKSVWGMQQKMAEEGLQIADLEAQFKEEGESGVRNVIKFLGQSYARGDKAYTEDPEAEAEIKVLNKEIFERTHELELYAKGREWSLQYFDWVYARLGTKFDKYFFESEVGEAGKALVMEYLAQGVFKESEGAVIFPGEDYGLHSRVFINSLGLPTYEAKELGLAIAKHDWFAYDQSIIVTGNEIKDYFQVLIAALKQIREDLAERTTHVGHGMVRLPEGKMSSRTGNIKTGDWLLDSARELALTKITNPELSTVEREELAEMVAVGAVKYALLRHSTGSDIEFDFEESVSFDGNSGPYLQYTVARGKSVIAKAQALGYKIEGTSSQPEPEEVMLLKELAKFPEVVRAAGAELSAHLITNYLHGLAQLFNTFYNKHLILADDPEVAGFRLMLSQASVNVLGSGLNLLGIKSPERM